MPRVVAVLDRVRAVTAQADELQDRLNLIAAALERSAQAAPPASPEPLRTGASRQPTRSAARTASPTPAEVRSARVAAAAVTREIPPVPAPVARAPEPAWPAEEAPHEWPAAEVVLPPQPLPDPVGAEAWSAEAPAFAAEPPRVPGASRSLDVEALERALAAEAAAAPQPAAGVLPASLPSPAEALPAPVSLPQAAGALPTPTSRRAARAEPAPPLAAVPSASRRRGEERPAADRDPEMSAVLLARKMASAGYSRAETAARLQRRYGAAVDPAALDQAFGR